MGDIAGILSDWADKVPSLLNSLLKKIYKREHIEKKTVVDLNSNKSAIRAQLLDNADINIILRITNFSPFELTVENVTLEFIWDGISKRVYKNNFEKITHSSEKDIFIGDSLSSEEARKIAMASDKRMNEPRLTYTIDFSNRLYRFQKYGELSSFNFDLINKEIAVKKLKEAS